MYYRKKNEGVRAGFKIGVVSQQKRYGPVQIQHLYR